MWHACRAMTRIFVPILLCLWPAALAAQETDDAVPEAPVVLLPGDPTGENFGVRVRRGPAILPPVAAPEDEEAEEAAPAEEAEPPVAPPPRRVQSGY